MPKTEKKPEIKAFFDPATATVSYVVSDPASGKAAIIDSVLDYDPKSGRTQTHSATQIIAYVSDKNLSVEWILETHAHADHLTAAPWLKERLGGRIGIGAHITDVQKSFGNIFNISREVPANGSQFDRLFQDGDSIALGARALRVLHTPGHTPACVTYVIEDAAFVGDTLFMPDGGTSRADFPGGDAATLYRSIRRILDLPPETRLFMCHDYAPGGRPHAWETTVAEERAHNIHVRDGISEEEFVAMRTARDKTLDMPNLLLPSIQVNIRAGHFPEPEGNGVSYLKIPLNRL